MNGVNCGAASLSRSATRIDLGYSKANAGILDPTKFRHISSHLQGPGPVQHGGWVACPLRQPRVSFCTTRLFVEEPLYEQSSAT
jgi:hypothetical protein